jgi:hypothetical protein
MAGGVSPPRQNQRNQQKLLRSHDAELLAIIHPFLTTKELTMKIQEAMKLATPGPLTISEDQPPTMAVCIDGPKEELIAEVSGDTEVEGQANAALICHWYNHGPELLSHLKSIIAAIRMNEDMGNWYEDVEPAEEVIAKCEEVEL